MNGRQHLYDAFGRVMTRRETRRPPEGEMAPARLSDRWGDYPSQGLTPRRLTAVFREADAGDVSRQAELFEEMEEKDAHLASLFQTRKLAVQGLGWEVLPSDATPQAARVADLCRSALESLGCFEDHVLDLLDAIPKGYSMLEILWDASEGGAVVRDLRRVAPKRITFRDSLAPRVITDAEPVRGEETPPWKFVYHRYRARSGDDVRAGLLRVCGWTYLFKNYALKDWVAFAEVFGMPVRVGKYDPGASRSDRDALIAAVRSLGTDAAGIISKTTEIEFVEAQRNSSMNVYESLVRFCDAQASKAVLGQTLTSEPGERGSGSYALGRVHETVRRDIAQADCRALAKTISGQLLRPLAAFNFGWDAPAPRFRFKLEPAEDLRELAALYRELIDAGFDALSREHVSERFRIPMIREGETPMRRARPGDEARSGER